MAHIVCLHVTCAISANGPYSVLDNAHDIYLMYINISMYTMGGNYCTISGQGHISDHL